MSPAPRAAWEAVLATDPGATALQTPEYFAAVLSGTGGRDASRLYHLSEGRQLVLPLVQQRALPGFPLLADFPGGFGHGSLLATGGLRPSDVRLVVGGPGGGGAPRAARGGALGGGGGGPAGGGGGPPPPPPPPHHQAYVARPQPA
ncbi:MAG: hypothetical protein ABWX96_17935, partial [Propionibacteriaceae bacterium]